MPFTRKNRSAAPKGGRGAGGKAKAASAGAAAAGKTGSGRRGGKIEVVECRYVIGLVSVAIFAAVAVVVGVFVVGVIVAAFIVADAAAAASSYVVSISVIVVPVLILSLLPSPFSLPSFIVRSWFACPHDAPRSEAHERVQTFGSMSRKRRNLCSQHFNKRLFLTQEFSRRTRILNTSAAPLDTRLDSLCREGLKLG